MWMDIIKGYGYEPPTKTKIIGFVNLIRTMLRLGEKIATVWKYNQLWDNVTQTQPPRRREGSKKFNIHNRGELIELAKKVDLRGGVRPLNLDLTGANMKLFIEELERDVKSPSELKVIFAFIEDIGE